MKKIIFFISVFLCFSLLAGCGGKQPVCAPNPSAGGAARLNLTHGEPPAPEAKERNETSSAQADSDAPMEKVPMLMLGGNLYCDTGEVSTELRCGMMDGEITSSVEPWERPSEDGQSNFGSGYGYQYARKEGTVEVNVDGQWRVFKLRSELRVRYCDTWYSAEDVSDETLLWLLWFNSLGEDAQMCVSFTPPDLYELCGYPSAGDVAVEDAQG